ncbi:DUF86 domain-containing protein [Acetobacteraceae bacterium]|nr:DUF86 domain-containing protein [Acetobacteraceae bacterium]
MTQSQFNSMINKNQGLTIFLDRMISHAQDAILFLNDKTQADYLRDHYCQKAVAMSLQIVGENASKISRKFPEFIEANSDIPWREIRGLRNQISHGYDDLNLIDIWHITKKNIPPLLEQLKEQLKIQVK